MSKIFAGAILVLVLSFLGIVGGIYLVTNYLFPLFGIGVTFSWELVLGVFGAIILLRTVFSGLIRLKS